MRRADAVRRIERVALPLAMCVLVVVTVLLALAHGADIIETAVKDDNGAAGAGELDGFVAVVQDVKGPATVAFGSLVPVGLLVGGALMATGNRKGIQFIASSAGAGAMVLLGNGIAA